MNPRAARQASGMTRKPELECLCGAREPDTGQPRPRPCWACGRRTMGYSAPSASMASRISRCNSGEIPFGRERSQAACFGGKVIASTLDFSEGSTGGRPGFGDGLTIMNSCGYLDAPATAISGAAGHMLDCYGVSRVSFEGHVLKQRVARAAVRVDKVGRKVSPPNKGDAPASPTCSSPRPVGISFIIQKRGPRFHRNLGGCKTLAVHFIDQNRLALLRVMDARAMCGGAADDLIADATCPAVVQHRGDSELAHRNSPPLSRRGARQSETASDGFHYIPKLGSRKWYFDMERNYFGKPDGMGEFGGERA